MDKDITRKQAEEDLPGAAIDRADGEKVTKQGVDCETKRLNDNLRNNDNPV